MDIHKAAAIFPLLGAAKLRELADDIKQHGQRDPIILWHSQVIDGRNRLAACNLVGVKPRFESRDEIESPIAFVLSVNLHRRHLTESQRGMVGARVKPLFEAEAKERQKRKPLGSVVANLPEQILKSRDHAARTVNVSARTVESAAAVLNRGAPELVDAVERGDVAVSTAAILARGLTPEQQAAAVQLGDAEILRRAREIRATRLDERRTVRMHNLAEISTGNDVLDASLGTFPILYADPPWRYEYVETESRAIENQYPTMELGAICALPVSPLCTDDCVLFMWATSPKLAEAMQVIERWGFTYRTSMVWVKDKIGMGYYARQRHELLLIATRGTPPTPSPNARPDSVVTAPRIGHSAKPVEFYEIIERMYPDLPRLELFCRKPREGWRAWGNQSGVPT